MQMSHLLLLQLLLCTSCCLGPVCGNVDCALYTRQRDGATLLDCRGENTGCCQGNSEYAKSRRLFIAIRRGDALVHWELSPPLQDQAIHYLPAGAFQGLDARLNSSVVLVLHRFHPGADGFSLAALSALPNLRHLSLRDSNLTCLPAGAFSGIGGGLDSLSLLNNANLACLQPGAFSGLSRLRSLHIAGSARLITFDAGAFCGLARLFNLSLELPDGTAAPEAALSHLPDTLSSLRLARGRQPADESAAIEFLPGLASFVCTRPAGLNLNGLPVAELLTAHLHSPMPAFCAEFGRGSEIRAAGDNACDATVEESSGVCAGECPARTQPRFTKVVAASSNFLASAPPPPASALGTAGAGFHERRTVVGSVLLTACAFTAGVLVSMYCILYQRRLSRLKPSHSVQLTAVSSKAAPALLPSSRRSGTESVSDDVVEPVRLVGFRSLSDSSSGCGVQPDERLFIVHRV